MNNDQNLRFHDRDFSWLSFNKRVLMEAADPEVPLYERVKFLAIYSSNLDEFFRVRVAALRSIVDIDKKKINKKFIIAPRKILNDILKEVQNQQEEFGKIKREIIIPELRRNGIILYRNEPIDEAHHEFVKHFFRSRVLSYLQPVVMTIAGARKLYLDNGALYFAVDLISQAGEPNYGLLNIPAIDLPRFFALPEINEKYYFIAIDDVIRENIGFLFPGFGVKGCYSIKLNRDADLNIEDEYSGDLVKKIQKQITKRNLGVPSRFLYDQSIPDHLLQYLIEAFEIKEDDLVPGGIYHNMNDLFQLPNPLAPQLENDPLPALKKKELESASIFNAIDEREVLLHFPYQSYDYVLRLFNEAAIDPLIKKIKATFYRVASDSFIINSLISAARNGKDVTVFMEIKARFDEENNLKWAEKMEVAGIKIIYSIPGLKVHAKAALFTKITDDGTMKQYGFFGTGNFNEKTASLYADQALLTCDKDLTMELDQVFMFLSKEFEAPIFKNLLVSQFNIIDAFKVLIDREIANVIAGGKGHIIIKLNNIEDEAMIDKLYEASGAGVKIEMIVRGICCLIPAKKGLSDNITVRRIVDRYLEHSRVYYFHNNGEEDFYLGSADWMKRNLYRRVEVVFPLRDPRLRKEVFKMLQLQLSDNVKACVLDQNLRNIPAESDHDHLVQAQPDLYYWIKNNGA